MSTATSMMTGVVLPGNSTVAFKDCLIPEPGAGQVLVRMKASSICGSDIRAIYREHLGEGPECYQGVIAGHEPCGQIVEVGPGCKLFQAGDRVVIYHIAGCGACDECKHGYMISCRSSHRAAYGWQRDGGHAPYLLAEESTCIRLPESLSYIDGALCACGFGTAYEALRRMQVSGQDRLLITGLGPVGLAAAMLGRALGVSSIIGTDLSAHRLSLAIDLELVDLAVEASDGALEKILQYSGGHGCEASIDCSGAAPARLLALQGTRAWGRCAYVGEGGTVSFEVSKYLIHKQIMLYGSWVTSLRHLEELVERLDRWKLHPEGICTHRLPLSDAGKAYELAAGGQSGKVCIVLED
ncbi:MAG TPA: zinc-binding dehydrogenase [Isosphaeraceae bacterium]|nr:zinc-binding dehydrogenase [Isosphaeraceae bacterium]